MRARTKVCPLPMKKKKKSIGSKFLVHPLWSMDTGKTKKEKEVTLKMNGDNTWDY